MGGLITFLEPLISFDIYPYEFWYLNALVNESYLNALVKSEFKNARYYLIVLIFEFGIWFFQS